MKTSRYSSGRRARYWWSPVVLIAVGALLLAVFGSSSKAQAANASSTSSGNKLTSITVAFPPNAASLPAYVALSKGYFKKEGLNVNAKQITNITQIVPLLGKGIDIGFGTQPILLNAASHGLPIAEVSGNESVPLKKPEYALVAGKDIKSPKQLAGKTIGAATVAGNINAGTLYTLHKKGVNINSIKVVQVLLPNALATLQAGRVAATETAEPFTSLLLSKGFHVVVNTCTGLAPNCRMSIWMANTSWAKANKGTVGKFTKALDLADKYIASNRKGALNILAAQTSTSSRILSSIQLSHFLTNTSSSDLAKWEDVLKVVDGIDITLNPHKLILSGS